MKKYIKKPIPVAAIQLNIETDGLIYQKWGGSQRAKPGDWIVNNRGEVYSIDQESFAATYEPFGVAGQYVKFSCVWAEQAQHYGKVPTKEGITDYKKGDFIVSNDKEGKDKYAVSKDDFLAMYSPYTEDF